MFTTLLKNQVECFSLALLSCQYLWASCWFPCDIHSLIIGLPGNFKSISFWDLVPRFLRLYIYDSDWPFHAMTSLQILKTKVTPIIHKALQILSFKTPSWISAGIGFNSIVSRLLYWELVTALHSNWIFLVSRQELELLQCGNSK